MFGPSEIGGLSGIYGVLAATGYSQDKRQAKGAKTCKPRVFRGKVGHGLGHN